MTETQKSHKFAPTDEELLAIVEQVLERVRECFARSFSPEEWTVLCSGAPEDWEQLPGHEDDWGVFEREKDLRRKALELLQTATREAPISTDELVEQLAIPVDEAWYILRGFLNAGYAIGFVTPGGPLGGTHPGSGWHIPNRQGNNSAMN